MNHQTYTARWIFPIDAPPIERGAITIATDKIVAVEPHGTRTPAVDLGNVAILPGFVNAHTHLDLTGARGSTPVAYANGLIDFTHWLRNVISFRRGCAPELVQSDIAQGIADCRRFGATLIGDIASGGASWDLLSAAKCRAVVFYEVLGLTEDRAMESWHAAQDWLNHHDGQCVRGLSPHAPYSVRGSQFLTVAKQGLPIATHLAETAEEIQLLHDHSGPFVDFLRDVNAWSPSGLVVEPAVILQVLRRGIFVHCNYLDPATPFLPTQTVVVCPRTHAAFGHPHHPFPKMNVRVALGTDGLASNPDLDILAEARFLRHHYPEVAPATILRMLTLNGAEALGFASVAGSLTPGKSADLVVLPLPDSDRGDPHDLILDSTFPVRDVMFRGEWVVRNDASRPP